MKTNVYEAIVTGFCACQQCCGPMASGLTSANTVPRPAHTIAAPRNVPLGSGVVVAGLHYRVEDRTARRYDGRFDIYFRTHKEAREFGIRKLTVTIITK